MYMYLNECLCLITPWKYYWMQWQYYWMSYYSMVVLLDAMAILLDVLLLHGGTIGILLDVLLLHGCTIGCHGNTIGCLITPWWYYWMPWQYYWMSYCSIFSICNAAFIHLPWKLILSPTPPTDPQYNTLHIIQQTEVLITITKINTACEWGTDI